MNYIKMIRNYNKKLVSERKVAEEKLKANGVVVEDDDPFAAGGAEGGADPMVGGDEPPADDMGGGDDMGDIGGDEPPVDDTEGGGEEGGEEGADGGAEGGEGDEEGTITVDRPPANGDIEVELSPDETALGNKINALKGISIEGDEVIDLSSEEDADLTNEIPAKDDADSIDIMDDEPVSEPSNEEDGIIGSPKGDGEGLEVVDDISQSDAGFEYPDLDQIDEGFIGNIIGSIGRGIKSVLKLLGKGLVVFIAGIGGSFLFGLPGLLIAIALAFGLMDGTLKEGKAHINESVFGKVKDKLKMVIKLLKDTPKEKLAELNNQAKKDPKGVAAQIRAVADGKADVEDLGEKEGEEAGEEVEDEIVLEDDDSGIEMNDEVEIADVADKDADVEISDDEGGEGSEPKAPNAEALATRLEQHLSDAAKANLGYLKSENPEAYTKFFANFDMEVEPMLGKKDWAISDVDGMLSDKESFDKLVDTLKKPAELTEIEVGDEMDNDDYRKDNAKNPPDHTTKKAKVEDEKPEEEELEVVDEIDDNEELMKKESAKRKIAKRLLHRESKAKRSESTEGLLMKEEDNTQVFSDYKAVIDALKEISDKLHETADAEQDEDKSDKWWDLFFDVTTNIRGMVKDLKERKGEYQILGGIDDVDNLDDDGEDDVEVDDGDEEVDDAEAGEVNGDLELADDDAADDDIELQDNGAENIDEGGEVDITDVDDDPAIEAEIDDEEGLDPDDAIELSDDEKESDKLAKKINIQTSDDKLLDILTSDFDVEIIDDRDEDEDEDEDEADKPSKTAIIKTSDDKLVNRLTSDFDVEIVNDKVTDDDDDPDDTPPKGKKGKKGADDEKEDAEDGDVEIETEPEDDSGSVEIDDEAEDEAEEEDKSTKDDKADKGKEDEKVVDEAISISKYVDDVQELGKYLYNSNAKKNFESLCKWNIDYAESLVQNLSDIMGVEDEETPVSSTDLNDLFAYPENFKEVLDSIGVDGDYWKSDLEFRVAGEGDEDDEEEVNEADEDGEVSLNIDDMDDDGLRNLAKELGAEDDEVKDLKGDELKGYLKAKKNASEMNEASDDGKSIESGIGIDLIDNGAKDIVNSIESALTDIGVDVVSVNPTDASWGASEYGLDDSYGDVKVEQFNVVFRNDGDYDDKLLEKTIRDIGGIEVVGVDFHTIDEGTEDTSVINDVNTVANTNTNAEGEGEVSGNEIVATEDGSEPDLVEEVDLEDVEQEVDEPDELKELLAGQAKRNFEELMKFNMDKAKEFMKQLENTPELKLSDIQKQIADNKKFGEILEKMQVKIQDVLGDEANKDADDQ